MEHVGKEKIVVVQFVAQFSRECQTLLPQWDKLAEMYIGDNAKRDDVTVALIDGWTFNSISQSYGITTFPSIIIFGKGDAQTQTVYTGEKNAEKISEWVQQFANGELPAAQPAETDNAAPAAAAATPEPAAAADLNAQPAAAATPEPTAAEAQPPQDQPQAQAAQEPQAATNPPPTDNAQAAPQEVPAQPAAPQQVPVQQAPPQPQEPREVNVVLNTTLLQAQFEELQRHTSALNEALQKSINDNFQRFESFKSLLDAHKQDLTTVGDNVRSHIQKFDEVKQAVNNQKDEIHKSVTGHTEKQVEELKNAVNQIKTKVFEKRVEEPQESSFGSGTVMFIVGGIVGAAISFVVLSAQGNKNRRKLLID